MLGIVLESISIHIRPHRHPRFARTGAIWLKLTQESLSYGSITEKDAASLVISAHRNRLGILIGPHTVNFCDDWGAKATDLHRPVALVRKRELRRRFSNIAG